MPVTTTTQYRVTGLSEGGTDFVNVSLVQVISQEDIDAGHRGGGSFTLTLPDAEAQGYFPGQVYDVTLSAAE